MKNRKERKSVRLIKLTKGKATIVDDEDFEWLSQWKWQASKTRNGYYATRRDKGKHVRMHRVVLGIQEGMYGDHINRNGLDNRRKNLRVATRTQNRRNSRGQRNAISGYKGVTYFKQGRTNKPWRVRCDIGGVTKFFGYFATAHEAARIYNKIAKEAHGEFAYLNAVPDFTDKVHG